MFPRRDDEQASLFAGKRKNCIPVLATNFNLKRTPEALLKEFFAFVFGAWRE